jgi:hypothetical protein
VKLNGEKHEDLTLQAKYRLHFALYYFYLSGTALAASTIVMSDALIELIKRKRDFGQTTKCKSQTQSIPDRRQRGSLYSKN